MERRYLLANMLIDPVLVSATGPVKAPPLRRVLIRRKPREWWTMGSSGLLAHSLTLLGFLVLPLGIGVSLSERPDLHCGECRRKRGT